MNILMLSYGDFDYDGRLRELYSIAQRIGNTHLISRGSKSNDPDHHTINDPYYRFVGKAIKLGRSFKDVDLLFLDNRKSIIPGLRLKRYIKSAKIVLDCRELYLSKYVKHLSGKLGCIVEKRGIKKADIIICANKARADYMRRYYHLERCPLVYENLRALSFSSAENEKASKERFKKYDIDGEFRIISTSGCDLSRMNDILVRSIPKVTASCRLFLVGGGTQKDISAIQRICESDAISNVVVLDRLNQDDLKALLGYCHIGIVNYHQKDLNNRFCASGKLYEFLYEGLPVVTTTNPPLVEICEKGGIGVPDDGFSDGITEVIRDYDGFRSRVAEYAATHSAEANNRELIDGINNELVRL